MIVVPQFADRCVAVLGLGRSGIVAARALKGGGARVWAWDDNEAARSVAEAAGLPLKDLLLCDWRQPEALVLSPGIPLTHPAPHAVVERARAANCPVLGDIELLSGTHPEASYVGITGTNGKSTTTALLGHIFKTAGVAVEVGGNLGTPALGLEPLGSEGTYVLELSSYQLDLVHEAVFDIAVLINISPDHLDRHGGLEGYVAAKRRIFRGQTPDMTAVVGVDDERSRQIYRGLRDRGHRRVVPISGHASVADGIYVDGTVLMDAMSGRTTPVLDLNGIQTLPGQHNAQNAAAAYAAARAAGIAVEAILRGIRSYPGLAHRQELIAVVGGVSYVNDSKATNGEAAARALACYENVYWIAGGLAKEGGLEAVEPFFPRIRHAFLIGEAAMDFRRGLSGHVPSTLSGDLGTAVAQARESAVRDGLENAVVLLSPACASFDQFTNFETRGDEFRRLVEGLRGEWGGER